MKKAQVETFQENQKELKIIVTYQYSVKDDAAADQAATHAE